MVITIMTFRIVNDDNNYNNSDNNIRLWLSLRPDVTIISGLFLRQGNTYVFTIISQLGECTVLSLYTVLC